MENRELVQSLVDAALKTKARLRNAREAVQQIQDSLRDWERELIAAERAHQKSRADINAAGFHDIGHARTELDKPDEAFMFPPFWLW